MLVLGGGGSSRTLAAGLVDMESIDPAGAELPKDFTPNAGRARDLALVFLRPSDSLSGELRAAPVTNHRYMLSALGAAAACTIKPSDTVYCCIPLHHPTSLLASTGSALASGARLALTERFDPSAFDAEVRRSGASLVFYAGDMLRPLVGRTRSRAALPSVRLFAGSGMRADLAKKLEERYAVSSIEFYAGTTHRAILANVDKKKPGALGRVLPGSDPVAVVRVDLATRQVDVASIAAAGEIGVLAVKPSEADGWIPTSDVVRRDDDGDYWFVDALSGFVGFTSTRQIEDAFYAELDASIAAAYAVEGRVWVAFVGDAPRERVLEAVAGRTEPHVILCMNEIPLTEGFRPRKSALPRSLDDARVVWSATR